MRAFTNLRSVLHDVPFANTRQVGGQAHFLCERFSGVERLARAFSDLLSLISLRSLVCLSRCVVWAILGVAPLQPSLAPPQRVFFLSSKNNAHHVFRF